MMKKISIVASLLGVMVWQAAHAGGVSPFYVGAGAGITNNNTEVDNLVADCRPDLLEHHNKYDYYGKPYPKPLQDYCERDQKDKSWNVYAGVNVSQNFGVEVGYVDLGKTADLYYSDPLHATQETSAITLSAIGRVPLGKNSRTAVYGKAGVARWKSELELEGHYGTQRSDKSQHIRAQKVEASGTSPVVGVGVEHDLSHNMALRVGWDRYFDVGEEKEVLGLEKDRVSRNVAKTVKTDVDVISAGVNYSFY